MGLDAVELVMEVEDVFGISIADEDYVHLTTVGELHQYILRQLQMQHQRHAAPPFCPSVPAFLETRRAITSLLPIERKMVRPKTQLAAIIPQDSRRYLWEQLQNITHIQLPPLVLPQGVRRLAKLATVGILVAAAFGCIYLLGIPGLFLAVLLCIGLLIALRAAFRPLEFAFPSHFGTVADIVRAARPPHYPSQQQPRFAADSDAVWDKLVAVIVDSLQVSPSDVRPGVRFIEDLYMD